MITDADVRLAAARIAGKVRRTPVFFAGPAWFKCEFMQHTGSSKPAGVQPCARLRKSGRA